MNTSPSPESIELSDPNFSSEQLNRRYFLNSSLQVQQEAGRGRFVVSTSSLSAGSKIIDSIPYSFAVEDDLKSIACSRCLKPSVKTMESLISNSMASVDAALFNERLDNGESYEDLILSIQKSRKQLEDRALQATNQVEAEHQSWKISCGKCMQVYYCSKECKKDDKLLHKLQCGALNRLNQKPWNTSDLTMARMIIQISAKRHLELNMPHYQFGHWGSEIVSDEALEVSSRFCFVPDVLSLVSNEKHILSKTLCKRRPLVKFIQGLSKTFPELAYPSEQVVALIGKIDQNTFGIRFDRNLSYAFGLYPTMSYFNHACSPNACAVQHNTVLHIMAIRDISPGEEINISYIETNRPTEDRRRCLQMEYNFFCRCERCNAPPTNSLDAFVLEYVCTNPECDGKGLLVPLKGESIEKACNICQSERIIEKKRREET